MPADDVPAGMGQEATIRYQRARLRVLQDELRGMTESQDMCERRLADALGKVSELSDELKRSKRGLNNAEIETQQQKQVNARAVEEKTIAERQIKELKKELDTMNRGAKQADHDSATKDVRLNRALEENERLKVKIRELKEASKEETQLSRAGWEQMEADVKRLQRQKTELIGVFKKQLRLIDVLKRQKAHIEAARLLAFSEEEFTKTLDIGGPDMPSGRAGSSARRG